MQFMSDLGRELVRGAVVRPGKRLHGVGHRLAALLAGLFTSGDLQESKARLLEEGQRVAHVGYWVWDLEMFGTVQDITEGKRAEEAAATNPVAVGGPYGAAARLGLTRTTLVACMKKHGIFRPPEESTLARLVNS